MGTPLSVGMHARATMVTPIGMIDGGATGRAAATGTDSPPSIAQAQTGSGGGAAAPVVDVRTVVQQAIANISLPAPTLHLGPKPDVNEWKMIAVGQPVWLWTDATDDIDASTTQQGIGITLVAASSGTTIALGDGKTITCTTSTPRPADAEPMAKSPDCGHTYLKPGQRTITATTGWTIRWSALGQSGEIPMERSTSRTIDVGELASVVVR
ncbi:MULTISPECIES: hypothetical protein [unclassified Luteococcus]|uniref:hypothetical protein n=1 Tax=unclassified Luteococcus TaxID=2639923 RepID=UPI00313C8DC4